jgi:antitoxin component YwqK of YwqJK toxin-antitoxin module
MECKVCTQIIIVYIIYGEAKMKTVRYDNGYTTFYGDGKSGKKKVESISLDRCELNNRDEDDRWLKTFYHSNGKKSIEIRIDNCGRKQGQETQWSEKGHLTWILNWKDNKRHGHTFGYDWSGENLHTLETWRDGVQSGSTQSLQHGLIVSESTYVDGEETGCIPIYRLIRDWEKEQIENKEEKQVA